MSSATKEFKKLIPERFYLCLLWFVWIWNRSSCPRHGLLLQQPFQKRKLVKIGERISLGKIALFKNKQRPRKFRSEQQGGEGGTNDIFVVILKEMLSDQKQNPSTLSRRGRGYKPSIPSQYNSKALGRPLPKARRLLPSDGSQPPWIDQTGGQVDLGLKDLHIQRETGGRRWWSLSMQKILKQLWVILIKGTTQDVSIKEMFREEQRQKDSCLVQEIWKTFSEEASTRTFLP